LSFDEIDEIRRTMTPHTLSPRHEELLRQVLAAGEPVAPSALERALQVSRPTINRDLRDLLGAGFLEKQGNGRSTRYLVKAAAEPALRAFSSGSQTPSGTGALQWSTVAKPLVEMLSAPLGTRTPVGYDNGFVSSYIPNQSSLHQIEFGPNSFS
jgi:DNA-binding transcriptional ArsR family regulator